MRTHPTSLRLLFPIVGLLLAHAGFIPGFSPEAALAQGGIPCDMSAPACDGDCPPGESCISDPFTGFCRCVRQFPPAGTDSSPTTGIFRVDVRGVGRVDAGLSGLVLLQWQDPQTDPTTGERSVQTEILSMDLSGFHPSTGSLNLRAGIAFGLPQTLGTVVPLGTRDDFPALASFDVFFEVIVQGVTTLRNSEPLVMEAVIDEIPPRNIGLRNAEPVLLDDIADPRNVHVLQTALHWMCPEPFPPPGEPCPVPCGASPFPVCSPGSCPQGLQCVPDSATGACACRPGFPPQGTDLSPTVGIFRVELVTGEIVDTRVSGDLMLQWQGPQTDPATGERSVQTEILSMDLSGSHPSIGNLRVTAGSSFGLPPTRGSVVPLSPGGDFPARATFDVFFEVEVQGVATLRNDEPLVMEADINEIPPRAVGLRNAAPVQITDIADPTHVDTLQTALHWMCPPPFPPTGPCPVPCSANPFPVCGQGSCPANQRCRPLATTGECRCVPVSFPPAGTDLSPSVGTFRVELVTGEIADAEVSGEVLLLWQDPRTDPATGQRTVQTEMLSMDLSGFHPSIGNLTVRGGVQQGLPPTRGTVVPVSPDSDFPALATFDVFFEVDVPGVATLRNGQPLVMQAVITEIPPRNIGLRNAAPVQIVDINDPNHVDTLRTSQHWMCPPPFPPPGQPCPVPCSANPFPVCGGGDCPPNERCIADPASNVCRCAPPFPPGGFDLSPTTGLFRVDVMGVGPVDAKVSGEVLLEWQDPQTDPATGQRTVQTEMLSMDLSGAHPRLGTLSVRAGRNFGLPPILGTVVPLGPDSDFPALASFDVFFEVEVAGVATLRNDEPLVMQAVITEIPPRNLGLSNVSPVLLTDTTDPTHVDILRTALHWMCPQPFPPPGQPCPVPCSAAPFPVCGGGDCPPDLQCAPDSASGACRCVPGYPPGGTDLSPTVGIFRVELVTGETVDTQVSGDLLLQWQDPQTDPATGERSVQTEILSMDLSGFHPSIGNLRVTAGSSFGLPRTLGSVTPNGSGGDFPARATFDVFFEVEVQGVATLRNDEPLVMEADINEIPPRAVGLRNAAPVQITDIVDPTHVDTLQTALHWMCPPPYPPTGPCPVPCSANPFPVCGGGDCPTNQRCQPLSATGECRCVPDTFPPAGTDLSPSVGVFRVELVTEEIVDTEVSGQVLLQWQAPQTDPATGERSVQTEMLSMDLAGFHPSIGNLTVRAGVNQGRPPTLGSVVPLNPGSDFPALASFDVFFEVEVPGVATLRNSQPLVMRAVITEIPPRNIGLRNAAPVQITDINDPSHVDTLEISLHWMCPPPFPPAGQPCPVPCSANPFPVCGGGDCPPDQRCVADAAANACRCVRGFPPAGFDLSPTTGVFEVELVGGEVVDAKVSGELLLQWQDPQTDPATGQRTVQTEMLSMDLSGSHPSIGNLTVRAGANQGRPPTLGSVVPIGPGSDFPAVASFDVFFEVDVQGVATLRNSQPLVMRAEITEIPPRNIALRSAGPIQITDINDPSHVDTLQTAFHWMCPPPFSTPGQGCPVPCSALTEAVCAVGNCPPGTECVSDPTGSCRCLAVVAAGRVPDGSAVPGVPLTVSKVRASTDLRLDWGFSCIASDSDYEVYEGALGSFYSHSSRLCSTGGAPTATLAPSSGDTYYLVVPRNPAREGSYGTDSSGVERPVGGAVCAPQLLGSCP